ncbi:MAG: reverse transcriptase-like protein [Chloroflexi bacterium]|nr:reverse transcriptase-like protein [Chloroflexota bacterium]
MKAVVVIFEGGSRGNPGPGYGSYAILRNGRRTVTRLEFGSPMTLVEASYDTLIKALEALHQQNGIADTDLEIRGSNPTVIHQITGDWQARSAHLKARHSRVTDLMQPFKSIQVTQVSNDDAKRYLS